MRRTEKELMKHNEYRDTNNWYMSQWCEYIFLAVKLFIQVSHRSKWHGRWGDTDHRDNQQCSLQFKQKRLRVMAILALLGLNNWIRCESWKNDGANLISPEIGELVDVPTHFAFHSRLILFGTASHPEQFGLGLLICKWWAVLRMIVPAAIYRCWKEPRRRPIQKLSQSVRERWFHFLSKMIDSIINGYCKRNKIQKTLIILTRCPRNKDCLTRMIAFGNAVIQKTHHKPCDRRDGICPCWVITHQNRMIIP
jgi:hypothetical protein